MDVMVYLYMWTYDVIRNNSENQDLSVSLISATGVFLSVSLFMGVCVCCIC